MDSGHVQLVTTEPTSSGSHRARSRLGAGPNGPAAVTALGSAIWGGAKLGAFAAWSCTASLPNTRSPGPALESVSVPVAVCPIVTRKLNSFGFQLTEGGVNTSIVTVADAMRPAVFLAVNVAVYLPSASYV